MSCSTNEIAKYNGSIWICATDVSGGSVNTFETITAPSGTNSVASSSMDTLNFANGSGVSITSNGATKTITVAATLGVDITSGEIVDGTITGTDIGSATITGSNIASNTIANSNLVNSSLTVTAGTGLSGGGVVALGGSVTLDLANDFGASIDSSEITDGTVATIDIADGAVTLGKLANCSTDGQILKYYSSDPDGGGPLTTGWNCASDAGLTAEVDGTIGNEVTDATGSGGLTRSGSGTSGSPYTLGIANGGVTNTMLVNSAVTVTAGTGLSGGGSVSLGGTVTLNSSLGTDIDSSEIVDGTIVSADLSASAGITNAQLANSSVTITAGNGLTTGGAVALGGTVTLDVGAGTGLTVNANDIGITADGIDYTELSDTLSLDATTTTNLGANNLVANLDSTGDYLVQDNGTTVLSILDNGTFLFKNSADNANSFAVQDSGGLPIFNIDTVANSVNIGTLVDDASDVLLVLDGVSGGSDPTGIAGGMYYNTTSNKFRCYENSAWRDCISPVAKAGYVSADVSTAAPHTTYVSVTGASFALDANTKYNFRFNVGHNSGATTTGIGFGFTTPASPTSFYFCTSTLGTRTSATAGLFSSYCSSTAQPNIFSTGVQATATDYNSIIEGYIETGASSGTLQLTMRAEVNAKVTAKAGSFGVLTKLE